MAVMEMDGTKQRRDTEQQVSLTLATHLGNLSLAPSTLSSPTQQSTWSQAPVNLVWPGNRASSTLTLQTIWTQPPPFDAHKHVLVHTWLPLTVSLLGLERYRER